MQRRTVLSGIAAAPFLAGRRLAAAPPFRRVRPGEPGWPTPAEWSGLQARLRGQLIRVLPPFAPCRSADDAACQALFRTLSNPYAIGDTAGLTQTLGWLDAWVSEPSIYAVAAEDASDVAAAVEFAARHRLRLVVKGGGHSYQGTSNAADSLLVWTRPMRAITLHDAFVPAGCATAPAPAVSIGAGAIWMHTYEAVTVRAGRYVQGGGCATVGVAGLIQGGGFGSFSKAFGIAAGALLEAEVVTADGRIRVVNECRDPDLFWGLKGAGNSLGVITRLTLRTRILPTWFGIVALTIKARSDAAFRRLAGQFMTFYAEHLYNPHWGEQARFRPDNALQIMMLFQGLDQQTARSTWQPLLDWVAASPTDFTLIPEPGIVALPARRLWDPAFLRRQPGIVLSDDRPGASPDNVYWAGNRAEAGWFIDAYESIWLPSGLLRPEARERFVDALVRAARHWHVSLHFNKGLAGAPDDAVAAARDTAVNPAVLDAFALAISASTAPPAYPGIPGHEPDLVGGRARAARVARGMQELRALVPDAGSYASEASYFDRDWQHAYWGANYQRLLAVKQRYDPDGLFFVHHGVGSEAWSPDGFTRLG
ncbi:MAG TPA: FAD-binding oxidoreductase [Acetobacteraceae bacterium]|nr:FAD-binding oxidoreductase [Acetobacteraceae bacterium]